MEFDIKTIVLGILAGLTAILTLLVSIVEVRGRRKTFFGFKVEDFKRYSAFAALILTMATYMVQTYKEMETNREEMKRQIAENDTARIRYETTMESLEDDIELAQENLKKQKTTLDKLNNDISLAHKTLLGQDMLFEKQKKTLRQAERSSMPLNKVYFSYTVIYENADSLFRDYYNRMWEIYLQGKYCNRDKDYRYITCWSNRISIAVKNRDIEDQFLPIEEELRLVIGGVCFFDSDREKIKDLTPKADLIYSLLSWVNKYEIDNYDHWDSKIEQPFESPRYAIEVDFKNATLSLIMDRCAFKKKDQLYTMTSLADIFYPENPDKRYISFYPPSYGSPKLDQLKIHFGEDLYGIDIPIEYCQRRYYSNYTFNVKQLQDHFFKTGKYKDIPGWKLAN